MLSLSSLLLLLATISTTRTCTTLRPHYVPPVPLENCIACEQESTEWSWGMKLVWFLVTVVTHIQYECCHVKVEPVTNRAARRRWTSVDQCGKRGQSVRRLERGKNGTEVEYRTVGGVVTGSEEIPWQVALLRSDGTWDGCGGVLLNCDPPVILTAAHCVQNRQPEEVMVALGIHNLDNLKKNTTTIYQVESIIIHPEFGP